MTLDKCFIHDIIFSGCEYRSYVQNDSLKGKTLKQKHMILIVKNTVIYLSVYLYPYIS